MLLYLFWSVNFAKHEYYGPSTTILKYIQATFLNVEELIKDHNIQVDGEVRRVRR